MATHLVNFSMHGDELQKAYEQVLDPSSPSNWALFGYFRNSSDLCVQATGSGGLQELADEFDDSKIQYAFVRIKEPRSQLLKCVFISWCGEVCGPAFSHCWVRFLVITSCTFTIDRLLFGSSPSSCYTLPSFRI